ncbi:MAG: DUF503 domain-containing protein [Firmicutes bacterium]|nr:DUF503 domain-containing protein [Bacillota bacterium]
MVIGACRLELRLEEPFSLKDKRRILKSLLARLQSRLNVAAAEVGSQDEWRRAELGIVTVANEAASVDRTLAAAVRLVESDGRAVLAGYETWLA